MVARIYGHVECYYVYVPTLEGVNLPPPTDIFNDQSEYLQQ